jgi:hypothetical protein
MRTILIATILLGVSSVLACGRSDSEPGGAEQATSETKTATDAGTAPPATTAAPTAPPKPGATPAPADGPKTNPAPTSSDCLEEAMGNDHQALLDCLRKQFGDPGIGDDDDDDDDDGSGEPGRGGSATCIVNNVIWVCQALGQRGARCNGNAPPVSNADQTCRRTN